MPVPAPSAATAPRPYRFDDEFDSAKVIASSVRSSALAADPILWHNFFSENDITWNLLRGRMGFRKGDLVLKGEDNTPVILSPKKPPIAWHVFEAVQIRMLVEGGREIKIKIGDYEFKQKLGPLGQYNLYRFDISSHPPADGQPLLIMPTDGLNDLAAINSIELVPHKTAFLQAAGRQMIGKREEYRNVIYAHSPATLTYTVDVPQHAALHFGLGIAEKNSPITFRLLADSKELYSTMLTDADLWDDVDLDLSAYIGQRVKLAFETTSQKPGTVALWSNPLLISKSSNRPPNVLLYMIDTLRADHTSLYHYARDTTPYLRKLGEQGLVFEDCTVQATWTKPSVASLMTSLYSFTHGITREDDTIPRQSTTLAEQLRAAGYVTASVLANPLAGRLSGLQRGFDYVSEWQAVDRYLRDTQDRATDSAAVNQVVFKWLNRHRDEPFFLYAHTTDPHAPYRPPPGFEEKFANPAESPTFNRDFKRLKELALSRGGFGISPALCTQARVNSKAFIQRAIDRYDGKILHNDFSLEQLLLKLRELGILENTLIIIVSDHGEEFWEHGWTGHGQSLYQELTHGVLVMWNPKLIPAPTRVNEPVQLIDVMPTVLDFLGLKVPDNVEGEGLTSLAKGRRFQRRGLVGTSRFAHPYGQHNELDPENHIDSLAVLDANWKLVYRENGNQVGLNKVELYDRRSDRADAKNVAAQNPQQVDRMMNEVSKWMVEEKQKRNVLGHGAKAALDRQTVDQLRSLGYLGGNQ